MALGLAATLAFAPVALAATATKPTAAKPAAAKPTASTAAASNDVPFWTGNPDAATFAQRQEERMTRAKAAIEKLTAVKGARTIANTLVPYDEAQIQLDAAAAQTSLMENVHPDSTLRAMAEEQDQKVSALRPRSRSIGRCTTRSPSWT
jgi:thimet oligopeptidase